MTGQHRQMLDQVLEAFHVVPNYDLSIMKDKQTLFDITTNILNRIKAVLDEVKPDVVLVHGDTSTTFVTALACFYLQIPVGHVEAGLRTYNIYSPYPEEFNRQAVSIISQYNFAPTELSKQNLLKEGKKLEIHLCHWQYRYRRFEDHCPGRLFASRIGLGQGQPSDPDYRPSPGKSG